MSRVCISRWNVPTPRGSYISFKPGEKVLLHSKRGGPTIEVTMIDGELKAHADVEGYVYEVRFPDEHGGGVSAVDADQCAPIFARDTP